MSGALLLGAVWVIAAAVVALLPMRMQYPPGILLLLAAPVLIGMIFLEHGWLAGGIALFALLSMFRRPLIYFARKALGKPGQRPEETAAESGA